jgi:hypothetical protein
VVVVAVNHTHRWPETIGYPPVRGTVQIAGLSLPPPPGPDSFHLPWIPPSPSMTLSGRTTPPPPPPDLRSEESAREDRLIGTLPLWWRVMGPIRATAREN